MILDPGTRLGPYEIGGLAGSGGMGDVYRGRDTRLKRDVAIKVLPTGVANSTARRARFEREARAVSRLNHPHICTIYDVGEHDGVAFIVMEFIEGISLEQRLRTGRLPLAEALDAAIQIASALCAAHEHGIVHRDLKPGNVMLADTGIKLLDFGIAKLLDEHDEDGGITSTVTLTTEHKIVGTINYMAPEQLEGRDIDQRADLFAFGALLYEMLTGQKAFAGSSAASVTAAVLTAQPPPFASVLPEHAAVPGPLDHIIRRALAKQPEERWQTARDVMLELRSIRDDASREIVTAPMPQRTWRHRFPRLLAALAVVAAAAVVAWDRKWREQPAGASPLTVLTVEPPEGSKLDAGYGSLAVAPDGLKIAFSVSTGGSRSLWIRYLNSTIPQRLRGTEDGTGPFWSPDSRFVAFYAGDRINRVDISGGQPQVIAELQRRGVFGLTPAACWLPDNTIVFSQGQQLVRVPATGGTPVVFATPDASREERSYFFPSPLPDGRVLFAVRGPEVNVGSRMQERSGQRTVSLPTVLSNAVSAAGHLIFRQGPALVAQRFDERAGRLTGQPVPLAYGVHYNPANGRTVFSASDDVLAYRADAPGRLTWLDRTGRRIGSIGDEGLDWNPVIAPDGSNRVVFDRFDAATAGFQVWTMDDQGHAAAFSHGVKERFGVWSPDGRWIAYTSWSGAQIVRRQAFGSERSEALIQSNDGKIPVDWTSDGRFIVYSAAGDLWMLPLAEPRTPVQLTNTSAIEDAARVSPDGRWLAYSTIEHERRAVWVQAFPGGSERQRVSALDAFDPNWRRDGKELYYMTADGTLTAVPVTSSTPLRFGPPVPLFRAELADINVARHTYAAAPDGQRFLVSETVQADPPITVVLHWQALVRQ